MKERPIIFNAEMVRAILDGQKTQTRRVIKPQPIGSDYWTERWGAFYPNKVGASPEILKCPYGKPGDRLWVRETWRPHRIKGEVSYKEDTPPEIAKGFLWRPSIYMSRWASRITLEITDIRVERVQNITEEDAWREGFPDPDGLNCNYNDRARYWFKNFWDSINVKRGYGWDVNPWVWVIEFEKKACPPH